MLRLDLNPELFTRRHPAYDGLLAHWTFVEATYKGGRGWYETNIFKYMKEGDKEFADRVERAYRFNHTREVVDLVTKYVFKGEVQRKEDAPDEVQAFWRKATRSGENIDALMREGSRGTSLYGQPYIVVDSTAKAPEEGGAMTIAEQKKKGDRVYAYMVKPQDALNMSFDDAGDLNWILFRETIREDTEFFEDHLTFETFRLWTRDSWHLFRIRKPDASEIVREGVRVVAALMPKFKPSGASASRTEKMVVEELASARHGLGFVPVVRVRDRDSEDQYHSPALVDDIAYLDRATANYLSNLDAIIQDQTFSQLVIPVQALDKGMDGYNALIEMGTKRILAYDGEGGSAPAYISPDPRQAGIILAVITKIITEIYHSVGMAGERTKMDNAAGIDNSSGVAKAYDFDRMNTMLKAKADRLEAAENEIARIVMAWHGKSLDEDLVRYPEEFDTRNLYDEFDLANRLTLLSAPDELRRHQMTRLVDKMFPSLAKDLKQKILDELKEWPVEEVDLTVRPDALQSREKPAAENKQGQNNKD